MADYRTPSWSGLPNNWDKQRHGLRVRIHDKTARINNLLDFQRKAEYESLEDSFKDLANYAIIALLVLRDKWDK